MAEPTMKRISTHGKGKTKGFGMYVFVYGEGKDKKSVTKHMDEADAKRFKNSLPGATNA